MKKSRAIKRISARGGRGAEHEAMHKEKKSTLGFWVLRRMKDSARCGLRKKEKYGG